MADANNIAVTISAKDQASATIDKMVADMAANQKRLAKAFKDAGLEVDNFNKSVEKKVDPGTADLAARLGLGQLVDNFNQVAQQSAKATASVTSFIPALAALGTAASVAGVGKLVQDWTAAGAKLDLMAQSMGISVDRLGQAQNAMRLAGGTAEEMSSSLNGLQTSMRDAIYRDPAKANLFRNLNIDIGNMHDGARRALDVLPQIANKVKELYRPGNPDAALHFLDMVGISRDALNLLKDGSAGLQRYMGDAAKLGTITQEQADRSRELQQAQEKLKISFEQMGYTMAAEFGPDLVKVLDRLSSWASDPKTRETISQITRDLIHWVESADWNEIGKAFERIGGAIAKIVDALSHMGDKGVGDTLATIMGVDPTSWKGSALRWLFDTKIPTPPDLRGGRQTPYVDDQGRPIGVDVGPDNDADHTGRTRRSTPPPGISGWWHDHMPGWMGGASPVSGAVPPEGRALLDAIAGGESDGTYRPQPSKTGAKGRYQFLDNTWREVAAKTGLYEPTPVNQDQNAWFYARQMYRINSGGRELSTDLKAGMDVAPYLNRTWTSLPGGPPSEQNNATGSFVERLRQYMRDRGADDPNGPATSAAGVAAVLPRSVGGGSGGGDTAPTGGNSRLTIDINHHNPPPGVSTTVGAIDPTKAIDINGPRVVRSMPGGWSP